MFGEVVIGIEDAQELMRNYGSLSSRPKADAIITKCGVTPEPSSTTATGPGNNPGVEVQLGKPANPPQQVPPLAPTGTTLKKVLRKPFRRSSTADAENGTREDRPRNENVKTIIPEERKYDKDAGGF